MMCIGICRFLRDAYEILAIINVLVDTVIKQRELFVSFRGNPNRNYQSATHFLCLSQILTYIKFGQGRMAAVQFDSVWLFSVSVHTGSGSCRFMDLY